MVRLARDMPNSLSGRDFSSSTLANSLHHSKLQKEHVSSRGSRTPA